MEAFLGLALVAFLSATILPGASEVTLAALVIKDYNPWSLWAVATAANTLGSVVNWALGRYLLHFRDAKWFPFKGDKLEQAERWFERRGIWALTLAWVPIVGDGLTFVAGVLRTPIVVFIALVGLGKALRYAVVVYLLLQVA